MSYQRLSMPVGEAMFTQRSIRKFKPDPIAIEDIHLIIDAASKAPNGGNRQVTRFLVLTVLYHPRHGRFAADNAAKVAGPLLGRLLDRFEIPRDRPEEGARAQGFAGGVVVSRPVGEGG